MSSKQDRNGVRTLGDLEYTYGKSFAETAGIATDARTKAEECEKKLNGSMSNEEIFNMLTSGGVNQGLFRYENGELFVNAEYLKVIDAIFTHDINMTGKFTYKTKVFLEPGQEEIDTIKKHILGTFTIIPSRIHLYDYNGDGVVNAVDMAAFKMAMLGEKSLADWSGAVESDVALTMDLKNPNKAFRLQGTNMWGREIDVYVGANFSNMRLTNVADYIVEYKTDGDFTYEKWESGKVKLWAKASLSYANNSVLEANLTLPFYVYKALAFGTINSIRNDSANLGLNVKCYTDGGIVRVFVHEPSSSLTSTSTIDVAVEVIGEWK